MADGWQGSTVRAILENPRYTGYAFFGRWTKHETLLDPDDVAAGSAKLADHPKTVNLREDVLVEALNSWIGRLFQRDN